MSKWKGEALMAKEVNEELATIRKLDPNPIEGLYKWIDRELGIPEGALAGGALHPEDALPVYRDADGKCHATAVLLLPGLLPRLKRPRLIGMVVYRRETGSFVKAIPLRGFQNFWGKEELDGLKEAMR